MNLTEKSRVVKSYEGEQIITPQFVIGALTSRMLSALAEPQPPKSEFAEKAIRRFRLLLTQAYSGGRFLDSQTIAGYHSGDLTVYSLVMQALSPNLAREKYLQLILQTRKQLYQLSKGEQVDLSNLHSFFTKLQRITLEDESQPTESTGLAALACAA